MTRLFVFGVEISIFSNVIVDISIKFLSLVLKESNQQKHEFKMMESNLKDLNWSRTAKKSHRVSRIQRKTRKFELLQSK